MECLAKILSRLPLRVLYGVVTWVIYPLMYYVVRYRRKVVAKNLRLSFPEKNEQERKALEKHFYHHFCDVIAEIIWSYRATDAEMLEHIQFDNTEVVEQVATKTKGVFFMLGHFGNWEWTADIFHRYRNPQMRHYNVYRQLKNASTDRLMMTIRDKRSGEGSCIEKNALLRRLVLLRKADYPFSIGLISDQKPSPKSTHYWTEFLHQDTGFLDGGEALAKKFGFGVIYVHLTQIRRGYYLCHFDTITDQPEQTAPNFITEQFARKMESNIQEQPELWLWSHNRWKWKRSDS